MMASKGKTELVHELDNALEEIKVQNPSYEKNLWEQYFPVKKESTPVYTKEELEYIKNAKTLNAVYNKGMIPLERYNEETGEFDGITADIFKLISEMSGLKFNFIAEEEYAQAYEALKNADVPIICSTVRDYEWARLHNAKISREYLNVPVVMVSKNQNLDNKTVVAMPKGLYLTNLIETNFTNYEYVEYSSAADCFEAILRGNADVTFADTYLAREYLKESKYSDLKAVSLSGYSMRYCIGFSSDVDDILISIIDKTLACISDDQINEFIVSDTMTYQAVSPLDLIYQNPVESILLIIAFFSLFIILLVVILHNKTKYAKRLYSLLYLDSLTKAPSFTKFQKDAEKLISDKTNSEYMLIYMNISKFKDINDMYGYTVGDTILKCISDNIKNDISSDELFARMYSDRFIVLLTYTGEADFVKRYTAFLEKLSALCSENKIPCRPHFTAGAYALSAGDTDINLAIDRAGYAHEQCCSGILKDYVFYNEELSQKILTERKLESEMEDALANEDFKVYFQPKIHSKTNAVDGAEALIRWQHDDNELIMPSSFIPLFEKNGFILKTDCFVFQKVCEWLACRKEKGKSLFPVSCNFSRLHFLNNGFPDKLADIADQFEVAHSLLEIEITETMAVEDLELVKAHLKRLKQKGFSVSIDDFGSGYSSLGILSEIEFDVVKLDRSLIYNATSSESNRLILSGIVNTIQTLDKKIVCEGVENQSQIDLLQNLNCYTIQGYVYAKPMPASQFDEKY